MKGFDIIAHVALKNSAVARILSELGTDVKYISLRQGDFILSPEVGIRYMTRERFRLSIQDRSVYRNILELKREFKQPLIIVEGEDREGELKSDITQLQTAIIFTSVMNHIPIIFSDNEIETAQLVFMISAQIGSGLDVDVAAKAGAARGNGDPSKSNGDLRQNIVEKIPDVGSSVAEALLKHFGNLSRLFAAKPEELQKVTGVGPKRAKAIHAFFNKTGLS